jgi:hypothetical protein
MHYVIIWQDDPEIRPIFKPLMDRGAGSRVLAAGGHHVHLCRMPLRGHPKGAWYDPQKIAYSIMATAVHALKMPAEGPAQMEVMFVFHQTSRAAVHAIMRALGLLVPERLDKLARSHNRDLQVTPVTILSCESGTDKTTPVPVPAGYQPWVDQSANMRDACFTAFRIRGVTTPGEYIPLVVTFSTGNPATGAISINPWGVKFQSLNGYFAADGSWHYNNDANGRPDHTATDTAGNVYSDYPPGTVPSPPPTPYGPGVFMPPLLPNF